MNVKDYQDAATRTAVYPGQGSDIGLTYALLGIVNEAGEVAGVLKKAYRQDDDFDQTRKFVAEDGDLLWYISAYYTEKGIEMPDLPLDVYQTEAIKSTNYATGEGSSLTQCVFALGAAAGLVAGAVLDKVDEEPFVALTLQLVAALAGEVGYTLEDVATLNLDKLASRMEAGTLKGSGDDR